MNIDGVQVKKGPDGAIHCLVECLSDALQEIIRANLAAIAHGAATSVEPFPFYSYKQTLKEFLVRYKAKDENTRKGMIGELLAHILIPAIFSELTSISILFNKEERSIKKGFDIIYFDFEENSTWYSEVKSGNRGNNYDSDKANEVLLERAEADLLEKFVSGRVSLWSAALTDVMLVLGKEKSLSVKMILSDESPLVKSPPEGRSNNAILVSVLYENKESPASISRINEYLVGVNKRGAFKGVIVFSIQKGTYQKVAEFLESEVVNG